MPKGIKAPFIPFGMYERTLAALVQGLVNGNPVHSKSDMSVSLASKSIPIDPLEAILGLPRTNKFP